jgi:hypothetical protein
MTEAGRMKDRGSGRLMQLAGVEPEAGTTEHGGKALHDGWFAIGRILAITKRISAGRRLRSSLRTRSRRSRGRSAGRGFQRSYFTRLALAR